MCFRRFLPGRDSHDLTRPQAGTYIVQKSLPLFKKEFRAGRFQANLAPNRCIIISFDYWVQ
jgi:hypothetical protein